MKRFALILAVTVAACSDSPAEPRPGDLALQRALWEQSGIVSYDYELTHTNEWFPPQTQRISVRNGSVTRIIDVATGDSIGPGPTSIGMTIDGLFDVAEGVLADAGKEEMTYELLFDPDAHYVRRVFADRHAWADDSFGFVARNLVRR